MTLHEYYEKRMKSPVVQELVQRLENYSKSEEYVAGTLLDVKTDEDCEILIDYIDNGEDVSYENILLVALEISDDRKKQQAL